MVLTKREIDFLVESSAIEDITNIDFHNPELQAEGRGYAGLFLEMKALLTEASLST